MIGKQLLRIISLFILGMFVFGQNSFWPKGIFSIAWSQETSGGVGLLLDYDPPGSGNIVVYVVTYKSPADKAKVKRGDRLLKVDGNDVTGKKLEEVAKMIRGPVGSSVVLSFITSDGAPKEVTLVRTVIKERPVVSLPPPSQVGKGVFLSEKEKALVKQKIVGLKTDAQRQRMLQLLTQLKNKQISKPTFMRAIKTEFPD